MPYFAFDKLNLPLQEKPTQTFVGKPILETDMKYLKMIEIQEHLREHWDDVQNNTGVNIYAAGVNPYTYELEVGISNRNWWSDRKLRYEIFRSVGKRIPIRIHHSEQAKFD